MPASLVAGTTWKWTYSSSDFPVSEGWVLGFRISGAELLEVETAVVGDHYEAIVDADDSDIAPGLYQWRALLSKAGEVYSDATGTIDVVANPSEAGDTRTFAAKQLAAIELEIASRFGTASTPVGSAHESYTIGGRTLTKIPMTELQSMRAKLSAEVALERNGGALPPYQAVFARAR